MSTPTTPRPLRPATLLGRARASAPMSEPSPGGEVVAVAGHPIHVRRCSEPGRPWVLLESALGCPCTEWAWVQSHLACRGINSLAWDRPGIGATRPAGRTADATARHVARLEALMQQEGIDDAVLVGHSVGALLVRAFAASRPERVRGLVLVEGTHPRQRERSPREADLITAMERGLAIGAPTCFQDAREASAGLPTGLHDWTARAASGRSADTAALRELRRVGEWSRRVASAGVGAAIPVHVLSAGRAVEADSAHRVLQQELAALGAGPAEPIVVPDVGHQDIVMEEQPASAVAAVAERAVRSAEGHGAPPPDERSQENT